MRCAKSHPAKRRLRSVEQRGVKMRALRSAKTFSSHLRRREDELRNHQANGPLADLWSEFVMNGTPSTLATYLKQGGEIDGPVRTALIVLLGEVKSGNPGGEKPWRDYTTFNAVELMLFKDRLSQYCGRSTGKPLTKRGAMQKYAAEKNRELRAVELQYHRGKALRDEFAKNTP